MQTNILVNVKKALTHFPFYLILLSIYPGISLLASNIREVEPQVVLRPLLVSLVFSFLIYYLHLLFIKNPRNASALTALFLIFFFNYGHFYNLVGTTGITDRLGNIAHLLLLAVMVLVYLGIRKLIVKRLPQTNALTFMSLALLVLPLYQIGQYFINSRSGFQLENVDSPQNIQTGELPDIYYIILDGYNREDTLNLLGYDNSPFLDSLRKMGFYVAECSQTNYKATALSLASTLNMDFLYAFIPNEGPLDDNGQAVYEALIQNRVRQELESLGYQIIFFQTGYQWNEWKDADMYLKPDEDIFFAPYLYPFEYIYVETTALKAAMDFGLLDFLEKGSVRHQQHYNRVHFVLDTLPDLAALPGPKFVFAHILIPHDPHIFLPDGSINPDPDDYHYLDVDGYINSIEFLNSRIEPIIKTIISDSEIPPVIVLQSDHGYIIKERRYFIFNAYYLPGEHEESAYPNITPVNTFRGIFNIYFGTHYPLKDDVSIVADIGFPFRDKIMRLPKKQFPCPYLPTP